MIAFVKGILHNLRGDLAVIDVNGLGYEINIHPRALNGLPQCGQPVMLHTHLAVSENEFKLYGFLDQAELDLFRLLLSISGIGAKAALNVLGHMEPARFYQAIASQDEKALLAISGVGKKSAQRLLFELKDKVPAELALTPTPSESPLPFSEVMEALEALGYNRSEVFPELMELKNQGLLGREVAHNVKLVLKKKAQQLKK
jgi:Holliday junction DNA helicase RuvA